MKTKRYILTVLSSILLLAISSCYKYPNVNVEDSDQDMTITEYNVAADFTSYATYEIEDTIRVLTLKNGSQKIDTLSVALTQKIRSDISEHMISRGYQVVSVGNEPDLYFHVMIIDNIEESISVGAGCSPGWGGWGGYYPGWGGYYPGYGGCWPYPAVSHYYNRTGSVVMELGDMKNKDVVNQKIPVIWTASLRGFLNESNNSEIARLGLGISEAFNQSPYITK